jgi:hypothetical protein
LKEVAANKLPVGGVGVRAPRVNAGEVLPKPKEIGPRPVEVEASV